MSQDNERKRAPVFPTSDSTDASHIILMEKNSRKRPYEDDISNVPEASGTDKNIFSVSFSDGQTMQVDNLKCPRCELRFESKEALSSHTVECDMPIEDVAEEDSDDVQSDLQHRIERQHYFTALNQQPGNIKTCPLCQTVMEKYFYGKGQKHWNYYHATSLPIAGPDGSRVLLTKPQCPYCQKQFSRLLLVQNHTRICKLAPKLAKKEPQPAPVEEPVQTHILTKEEFLSQVFVGNSKQRMCPICQSKLNSKDEARYHWESKHAPSLTIVFHDGYTTDISKPECPRCRRQFKNLASTKFHAKNNCYGDGIAQVTSKADYDRLLENSDQKTCPICKASLGGDAQQHWELSHRQVFQITFEDDSTVEISEPQCPRCHKQFKTMMATRSHARKHCHWRPNTLIKEEMPRLIPRQIHITEPLTTDLPSESSDSPVNPLLMILEAAESLTMAKHHT